MKLNRIAKIGALGAVAALALTACAANEGGGTSGDASAPASDLAGNLVGAGASSQEVAVQTWSAGFQGANPEVTVDYDPAGSGTGRESFQAGAVAFAGSDRAFNDEELGGEFAGCVADTPIIELPAYISPIAVIFNLEGVDSLNLDAATLAGIFAGTITNWNDPAIAATNDGVELPDLAISPVHRADDSGTTENFTDYLYATAPDVWTSEPDGEWPLQSGEAATGTSGVVDAVTNGTGTIGYADASRAADLGTVAIQVGEEFVSHSPEGAAAAVDASPAAPNRPEGDLAIELDRTTTEAGAYPLVLISYLIACSEYTDAAIAPLVKGFLSYAISAEGQDASAAAAGNAPISDALREQSTAAIELIVAE